MKEGEVTATTQGQPVDLKLEVVVIGVSDSARRF